MRVFTKKGHEPAPAPVVRVLLVCMGNICRSPMAEGMLRQGLVRRNLQWLVEIDSAGTNGFHAGAPPDPRAQAAVGRRGFDIGNLRAREIKSEDFEVFDLLLAMDRDNLERLLKRAPPAQQHKVGLLREFAGAMSSRIVPDPYYGGVLGFEKVLDILEESLTGVLDKLELLVASRLALENSEPAIGPELSAPPSSDPV